MTKETIKNNRPKFPKLSSTLIIVFCFFIFGATVNIARADCTLSWDEAFSAYVHGAINISMFKIDDTHVQTTVDNGTDCALPTVIGSYRVYDNISPITQTPIDERSSLIIPAQSSHTFISNIATCLTQVDIWYSMDFAELFEGHIFGIDGSVFDSVPSAQGLFCTIAPPPPPPAPTPDLIVSCSVSTSSAPINTSVAWSGNASGGTGTYTYSWTGTDSLADTSSTTSKIYSNSGTKDATVVVTSGTATSSVTCTTNIYSDSLPSELSASCSASPSSVYTGNSIIWSAIALGGMGNYTYLWTGTDSLSGTLSTTSLTYSSSGTKDATVVVTSGTSTTTANCSAVVNTPSGGGGGGGGGGGSSFTPMVSNSGGGNIGYAVYDNSSPKSTQPIVLAYSQANPLVSSIYLSQIPYTGTNDLKVLLFEITLALWSGAVTFIIMKRREKQYLQHRNIQGEGSGTCENE
ncbi:MAG: PKD domain-containing protein [Candidatus Paceibacterota bacterium]|jgi:hypothetical protein